MNKIISKKEFMSDLKTYFSLDIHINVLRNYIKLGLIQRISYQHKKGVVGSTAEYPRHTPGMIYLIHTLKTKGFKLKEIKIYLDLLMLDFEALRDIRDIIESDKRSKKNILFEKGITPEVREYMLKEIPLKLLNLKNLQITRWEKFEQIIELRAYAELNYKQLTKTIIENSKDLSSFNKIQEILDSPGVETNIDKIDLTKEDSIKEAYISVRYGEPFYKTVLFKENKIEVISD